MCSLFTMGKANKHHKIWTKRRSLVKESFLLTFILSKIYNMVVICNHKIIYATLRYHAKLYIQINMMALFIATINVTLRSIFSSFQTWKSLAYLNITMILNHKLCQDIDIDIMIEQMQWKKLTQLNSLAKEICSWSKFLHNYIERMQLVHILIEVVKNVRIYRT